MKKYFEYLKTRKSAVKIAKLSAGNLSSSVIYFSSLPLITRLYEPSDFGNFAIFLVVISILSVLVNLRYDKAILLTPDKNEALIILLICNILCFFLFPLLAFLLWLININVLYNDLPLASYIFYCLGGLLVAAELSSSNMLIKLDLISSLNKQRLSRSVILVSAQIIFAYIGENWNLNSKYSLLLAYVIAASIAILYSNYTIKNNMINKSFRFSRTEIISIYNKYSQCPKYLMPTAILNSISNGLLNSFLKIYYGATDLGQVYLGQKLVSAPAKINSSNIQSVLLSSSSKKETKAALTYYNSFLINSFKISFPIFIIAMLVIPPLIPFILGSNWILASKYVIISIPIAFLNLIFTPFMMIFVKLNLSRQYTAWAFFRVLLLSSVLFMCYSYSFTVFNTLFSYAVALAACYIFAYAYIRLWANSQLSQNL